MNRAGKPFALLFLCYASLVYASTPNSADPGVYNLSDQDLSPALRDCLTKKTPAQCFDTQVAALKGPVHVPSSEGDSSSEQLDNGWRDFLHSSIGNPEIFKAYSAGAAFGFAYGMSRVDPEQVLSDPNMAATNAAQGDQAVWVVHTLEVAPGTYLGTDAAAVGDFAQSKSYYGGLFEAGGIVRLTKRHPLDQVYTDNFWGAVGKEVALFKQSLPDYIRVPTELIGSGLLAGEGIQLEGFLLIEIGIGPTTNFGVTPSLPFLGAGVFGSAGLVTTLIPGHFNTKMEVEQDQTLRVTLEKIHQNSEELDAQINAGIVFGPFSLVKSLLNLEAGVTHTKETLLDLSFDPKFPQAQHALREAYFGRFKEAQDLASSSDTNYLGVKEFALSSANEKTTNRDVAFLMLNKGSSESRSEVNTQLANPVAMDDKTEMDEEDSHSTGFFGKSTDMQIAIRNDGDHPEMGLDRSLSIKYTLKASRPSQEEIQQFVDIAQIFNHMPTAAPIVKKPLQGYFFLNLDIENVKALLTRPPGELEADFKEASALMPGASDHWGEIEKFAKILSQALAEKTPQQQDQALTNGLRGKNFDLYSIGVLSLLVDNAHSLVIERVTFTAAPSASLPLSEETLEFSAVGTQFEFPAPIEY